MIEIKDLLARFNSILLSEELKVESVKKVIQTVVGIEIQSKDIQIKKDTVYLNIKPIYKNEIYLKKDRIAEGLELVLGKRAPQNMR